MVNSVYRLGDPEPEYTGDAVTDTVAVDATVVDNYKLMWTNIVKGVFRPEGVTYADGGHYDAPFTADVKVIAKDNTGAMIEYFVQLATDCEKTGSLIGATWYTIDPATGKAIPATALANLNKGDKIAWRYDNIVVPQEKLPTLRAEVTNIPLMARARR